MHGLWKWGALISNFVASVRPTIEVSKISMSSTYLEMIDDSLETIFDCSLSEKDKSTYFISIPI